MGWIVAGVIVLLLCIGAIYGSYCLMGGREID
jgi:hypothetical protein